ncbi:DUF1826 domain-containing protein [Alteromonas sp. 1_MG-2023]|uniref:DUF1826 domain-containing protein n=1 Tax=Alteromonas sp. 1_MG-2023 TaxID=3062669 RepID=UPI0026E28A55|nr:DUF1826 domain-containing protein [Alteromonas sp. 1_MG-2023]MDO6566929.1 DUF1826 domain-containing protein [Alteromonas sp. 1_MG-2023]
MAHALADTSISDTIEHESVNGFEKKYEATQTARIKKSSTSEAPIVLTDIYKDECNIAIWQRRLNDDFLISLTQYVQTGGKITAARQLSSDSAEAYIRTLVDDQPFAPQLHAYIAELVDMFICLFEAKTVGFRLSTLDKAMCPRFHVDRVPCRLVTTFLGSGSQWLEHDNSDRNKLGHKSGATSNAESGLYSTAQDIQTLNTGDVAILKGELWHGNENAGIVHRSPPVSSSQPRIVMTLDLVG